MTPELSGEQPRYLALLSEQYPTVQDVCTEIINLKAILNLPKGTEHFMSDLHGEYEAFTHILHNCSGVIREKVDLVFGHSLTGEQCSRKLHLNLLPRTEAENGKENLRRFG